MDAKETEEVRPLTREEWISRLREEGRESLVRSEMLRLGFWKEKVLTEEEQEEKRKLDQEYEELSQELKKLKEEHAKLEDVKKLIREARAKRIEESKKRRAERKLEREKALAKRREEWTAYREKNVIHLGKGVSHLLEDKKMDEEKLMSLGLPLIRSSSQLADEIGISLSKLKWLTYHRKTTTLVHYHRFTIPKKSGGEREISAPKGLLRQAQTWVKSEILDRLEVHPNAIGFVKEKSTVDNAKPHVGKQVVIKMDLKDFFPTIHFCRVRGLFQSFGYSGEIATILALLCTEPPRQEVEYKNKVYYIAMEERQLPQGACTSPAITNLICRRLDHRLCRLSEKLGFTYTRYADDLTFSSDNNDSKLMGHLMGMVRKVIKSEGFQVNEEKTRVLRASGRQRVTGIVVNDKLSIDRQSLRRFRALLHNVEKNGLEKENRQNRANFWQYIVGYASYIRMVRPDLGEKLEKKLIRISEKYGYPYTEKISAKS